MKSKLLTILGLVSIFAVSAHAGGIHCDDDPKCLPCIPGVACHKSGQANLNNQVSNDDAREFNGEEAKDLFDSMTGDEVTEGTVYGSGLRSILIREAVTDDGQILSCSEIHHGIGIKYGTNDYHCSYRDHKIVRVTRLNVIRDSFETSTRDLSGERCVTNRRTGDTKCCTYNSRGQRLSCRVF